MACLLSLVGGARSQELLAPAPFDVKPVPHLKDQNRPQPTAVVVFSCDVLSQHFLRVIRVDVMADARAL